jgi:hypothetical protein
LLLSKRHLRTIPRLQEFEEILVAALAGSEKLFRLLAPLLKCLEKHIAPELTLNLADGPPVDFELTQPAGEREKTVMIRMKTVRKGNCDRILDGTNFKTLTCPP